MFWHFLDISCDGCEEQLSICDENYYKIQGKILCHDCATQENAELVSNPPLEE